VSLYAINQRVWVRSQQSLGFISEARYVAYGGKRKAEYVITLVEHNQRDWMCGSKDLRAADWCCDGCDRWLPGHPHATGPDGEYPNGLSFCFLCVNMLEASPEQRDMAAAYGYTRHP
jgi:hypothetical protein